MSGTTGTGLPGSPTTLFDHALRLHELAPEEPLHRDGEPYPDDGSHRRRRGLRAREGRHSAGTGAALILDRHFARASSLPAELADAFHDVYVPILPNEHIAAVAERADRERVRHTGRWLVRHGSDRCPVTVGLALLAAAGSAEDIPLIRTIGLLSYQFGPLAARALERQPEGAEALLWLAERVTGWGRVHVVEALCGLDDPAARSWLLRRACDGDFLNGYFAGEVATVARLHEALADLETDSEMVDHTGRLLHCMSDCDGMGLTLARYPHAKAVLEAHARHVGSLSPTTERYFTIALLTQHLTTEPPEATRCSATQREAIRATYLEILDRAEWTRTARAGLAADDNRMRWLTDHRAPRLRLRAFPDREPDIGEQHTPGVNDLRR
ncbi:hypothetical protein H8N01_28820 [Streptomyces sp. AC536]|uniref:hypothetical protein n=1 Tax=Streptomyces buecherae TaxID=2763006 RepID=UPI00164E011A|nr:hypothetical protein [Streptomyces buecherae]MBC3986475.1 hypothetical protein [Streptomyces buecherae]QNJ39699.1 hypothetical protein H7H31_07240 [Streptomyces buecherae]